MKPHPPASTKTFVTNRQLLITLATMRTDTTSQIMARLRRILLAMFGLLGFLASDAPAQRPTLPRVNQTPPVLKEVEQKFAPDPHVSIFRIGIETNADTLIISGEVDKPEAKIAALEAIQGIGPKTVDRITVLPDERLGEKNWGIATLSVASGREEPDHKAELGTQILMGRLVRVWKGTRHWFYVQSPDGYLSWIESGSFVVCTKREADAWSNAPLLMVTGFEERVLEKAHADAESVSDVVMGDLVKQTGEQKDWFSVELPDGRAGFLPKKAAQDYKAWSQSRHPTAENIEKTARLFLGRPYLWGGNSPKGLDCSGFCKLTFLMNGIELNRNAGEQVRQGAEVPLDPEFSKLKKGDLLFFGWARGYDGPEWITHVAIYLGNKSFIQSAEMVRISSLDPSAPNYDEHHSRALLYARRILQDH
jgi:cell wall-associated NlpC family hydrolase